MTSTNQKWQEPLQQTLTPKSISKPSTPPILQVNFSWRKFESLVSEKAEGSQIPKPLYIVDYHTLKIKPRLIFKSVADDSTIGTGVLHPISINADVEIRGKATELQATSRIKTQYMHLSHNFSDTDEPVPMTWASECNFKTWDFVCLDPNQLPVARYAANVWAIKKVGNIEFLGERTAMSEAAREEIVITGITLFSCMMLRMNNFLNLFGMVSKPAKVEDYRPASPSMASDGGLDGRVAGEAESRTEPAVH
ncbi:hypothetical protein BKA65DRAFT_163361 [Rhexocercosporidium sp. MPI-PUGE-AT-0058]|nr:hypothetical protein BKA65DRAFT_163361 [Rhexocercosporidium sp. MPI-PUGE-AT-0058]